MNAVTDSESPQSFPQENGVRLDVSDPPEALSYSDYEDYRHREILRINGIALTEQAIAAVLDHPIGVIQSAAAHTVGSAAYQDKIPALKKLLTASDDLVKVEAAYALARLHDAEGPTTLKEMLKAPVNAYLSAPVAAGYLARLGDPAGYPVLERGLATDLEVVRMVACKQIFYFAPFQGQKLANGEQVDLLKLYGRALADPIPSIAWQALVQLQELRLPQSRPMLEAFEKNTTDQQSVQLARGIIATLTAITTTFKADTV